MEICSKCNEPVYNDEYCFLHFNEMMEGAKKLKFNHKSAEYQRKANVLKSQSNKDKTNYLKELSPEDLLKFVGFNTDRSEYEDCISRDEIHKMKIESKYGNKKQCAPENDRMRKRIINQINKREDNEVENEGTDSMDGCNYVVVGDGDSIRLVIEPREARRKRSQYDTDRVCGEGNSN